VDQYMDDVRFPGSFLYLFACSGGSPIARETMYPAFYERGVSSGWVGFNQANADLDAHRWATRVFFEDLVDPARTFRDVIPDANTHYEGNEGRAYLTLFDEPMGDNKLYIQLPDLTVSSLAVDAQNQLSVEIQNIGQGTIRGERHEIDIRLDVPGIGMLYHGTVPFDVLGPQESVLFTPGIVVLPGTQVRARITLVGMVEPDNANNILTAQVFR